MNQQTALAGIPIELIDTRDPMVAKWALDRIKDLLNRSDSAADGLARILFDEPTIRTLLTTTSDDILMVCLMRDLPEELIVPHLPWIADNWQELPYLCSYPSAELLASHNPDRAAMLFLSYLGEGNRCSDRMFAVLRASLKLPAPERVKVADAVMVQAFKEGQNLSYDPFIILPLTELAWSVDHSRCSELLAVIAEGFATENMDELDRHQMQLTEMLMGEIQPIDLMTDNFDGYKVPRFSDLALFLPDTSLAAELDAVIEKLANFDYMATIEFYERHKHRLPERVRNALDLLHDFWLKLPELSDEDFENTASLFALFPACIAAAAWVAEPVPPIDDSSAILARLTTEVQSVPVSEAVISHFASMNRCEAVRLLAEALEEHKERFGALRIVEIMGRLGWQDFVPQLLSLLDTDFDRLCEKIEQTLKQIGPKALDAVIEALETDSEVRFYHLTSVLETLGGDTVAAYMDRNLDGLIREDKEWAMALVEAVPEQRFIARIAPMAGRGQREVDRTWLLLNKLHGMDPPEMAAREKEWYERELESARRRELFEDGDLGGSAPSVMHLEMVCSACGDVSRYDVEQIYVPKTDELPYVADELACIACGAQDSLEPSPQGAMAVSMEMMRISLIKDKEERADTLEYSPLHILPPLKVMGKEMGIRDGFKLYRDHIGKEPGKGEYQLGLGNILKFVNKTAQARVCYEEAVRLDPKLIEGWFHLAVMDDEKGEYRSAFLSLHQGVTHLPDVTFPHLDATRRSEFVNAYVNHYNGIKQYLKIPGPLIHHSMFGLSGKVGRNDPCTCGSGKKFKKCCGK